MERAHTPFAGKAIIDYIETRGIRQTWLARQVGMPPDSLNRYLHGRRGYRLTRTHVESAADALDVPAATRREWLSLLTQTEAA